MSSYTENDIKRSRLAEQHDPHAHARIDALQEEVARQMSMLAKDYPGGIDEARNYFMRVFRYNDDQVRRRLALPVKTKSGRMSVDHAL